MITPAVQELCLALWTAREEGVYLDGPKLSRELHVACAADIAASETYVPQRDVRVMWALQVIGRALQGFRGWQAKADKSTEAMTALLLDRLEDDEPEPLFPGMPPRDLRCGKDRAAGN